MELADIALCCAVLIVAFLYSSVGHAGASGYIAVMALASVASPMIRPTALVLNIVVATIGSVQFWRAGHFRWSLFWPFALVSIPAAYYGGKLTLPTRTLNILIGLVLLASAARLLIPLKPAAETHPPAKPMAMLTGRVLVQCCRRRKSWSRLSAGHQSCRRNSARHERRSTPRSRR